LYLAGSIDGQQLKLCTGAGRHVQKYLPSDLLAKIDFIAFFVRRGDAILKSGGVRSMSTPEELRTIRCLLFLILTVLLTLK